MRTVRTRGPRRRGDSHNLVRSVPAHHQPVPPQPLIGYIERTMKAETLADYESISDTSWTSGTTGNFQSYADTSWNCLYHHFVVSDRRTDNLTWIMDPIRWSLDAPAASGGTYDWWWDNGFGARYSWHNGGTGGLFGAMAIVDTLLVSPSHAEPNEGFLQVSDLYYVLQPIGNQGAAFSWQTINAISGATVLYCSWRIYAVRHRVNGAAVGNLEFFPPASPNVGTKWRFPCSAGDSYELDVWYEITYKANPSLTTGTGKCCLVLPQTRVFNGSRRTGIQMPPHVKPYVKFTNVNFNTAFDRLIHTYELSKTGAPGWTLKGGTDGPHPMITADGWTAEFHDGMIVWTAPADHLWVAAIRLFWRAEIPYIALSPGPSLRSSLSWSLSGGEIYYRPLSSGDYWATTVSTDLGTITHSPNGVFDQAGTTTWSLVTNSQTQNTGYLDGKTGIAPLNFNLPSSFVTSRVSQ